MTRLLFFTLALASVFFPSPLEASKRKLVSDTENTEGALIRYFISTPAPPDKVVLMESFVDKYPNHISTTWVLAELQAIYVKAGKFDQAIAAGDKILAVDPDDLAIAQENLRAAEATKDLSKIRQCAKVALHAAKRLRKSQPEDPSFVQQVESYADYTLYSVATSAPSPVQRTEWMEQFAREHPESLYAPRIRPQLFAAYQQAGHHARALQLAEEELKSGANNADMLFYAATRAYEKHDKGKVTVYAKRLLETLPAAPAPQGIPAADWSRNKHLKIGIARWMLGVLASQEQRWPDADLHLRAALPLVGQNKDIHAETLYHLGLVNLKLGEARQDTKRLADAVRFNQLCAAIPGAFQSQAKQNAASIRSQYHLQ